jgi:hypothetical protein
LGRQTGLSAVARPAHKPTLGSNPDTSGPPSLLRSIFHHGVNVNGGYGSTCPISCLVFSAFQASKIGFVFTSLTSNPEAFLTFALCLFIGTKRCKIGVGLPLKKKILFISIVRLKKLIHLNPLIFLMLL